MHLVDRPWWRKRIPWIIRDSSFLNCVPQLERTCIDTLTSYQTCFTQGAVMPELKLRSHLPIWHFNISSCETYLDLSEPGSTGTRSIMWSHWDSRMSYCVLIHEKLHIKDGNTGQGRATHGLRDTPWSNHISRKFPGAAPHESASLKSVWSQVFVELFLFRKIIVTHMVWEIAYKKLCIFICQCFCTAIGHANCKPDVTAGLYTSVHEELSWCSYNDEYGLWLIDWSDACKERERRKKKEVKSSGKVRC